MSLLLQCRDNAAYIARCTSDKRINTTRRKRIAASQGNLLARGPMRNTLGATIDA